jgi:hypothetical protein
VVADLGLVPLLPPLLVACLELHRHLLRHLVHKLRAACLVRQLRVVYMEPRPQEIVCSVRPPLLLHMEWHPHNPFMVLQPLYSICQQLLRLDP